MVVLFFGPCIFIYLCPLGITWVDKFLAVFYAVITPLLNPAIYTLRNKEIKIAIKRLWCLPMKVRISHSQNVYCELPKLATPVQLLGTRKSSSVHIWKSCVSPDVSSVSILQYTTILYWPLNAKWFPIWEIWPIFIILVVVLRTTEINNNANFNYDYCYCYFNIDYHIFKFSILLTFCFWSCLHQQKLPGSGIETKPQKRQHWILNY